MESRGYHPNLASSAGHISIEHALLFATFYRCAIKFLELAVLFTGIEDVGVQKYWLGYDGGVSRKIRLSAIISKDSLGSSAKARWHHFVARLLGFVIGHFRWEAWRSDIKAGRVLEPPNNIRRQFPLPVACDAVIEYLTDQR